MLKLLTEQGHDPEADPVEWPNTNTNIPRTPVVWFPRRTTRKRHRPHPTHVSRRRRFDTKTAAAVTRVTPSANVLIVMAVIPGRPPAAGPSSDPGRVVDLW